jgi:hypothetical protein
MAGEGHKEKKQGGWWLLFTELWSLAGPVSDPAMIAHIDIKCITVILMSGMHEV